MGCVQMTTNSRPVAADKGGPFAAGAGEKNKLRSLADLVRLVQSRDGGLWCEAAAAVLGRLEQLVPAPELFQRSTIDAYAQLVDARHVWRQAVAGHAGQWLGRAPGRASYSASRWGGNAGMPGSVWEPARSARIAAVGVAGALLLLRESWVAQPQKMPAALDEPWLSRFAIRASLASELFDDEAVHAPLAQAKAGAPAIDPRVVQPTDGYWPRQPGDPWTEPQKSACREMRSNVAPGFSTPLKDVQIAKVAGCNRDNMRRTVQLPQAKREFARHLARSQKRPTQGLVW